MAKPIYRLVPASTLCRGDEIMLILGWREEDSGEVKRQVCQPVRITSIVKSGDSSFGTTVNFRHTHGSHYMRAINMVYRRVK